MKCITLELDRLVEWKGDEEKISNKNIFQTLRRRRLEGWVCERGVGIYCIEDEVNSLEVEVG